MPADKFCRKCQCVTARGSQGRCKPCAATYAASWRKANPEKVKEIVAAYKTENAERLRSIERKWRDENREKYREKAREWHRANRDVVSKRMAIWRKENPEVAKARKANYAKQNPEAYRIGGQVSSAKRRARKRLVGGSYTASDVKRLLTLQKRKCAICHAGLGACYHVDHVLPLALGGSNWPDNLQLLCPACNRQKGARHPVDFMQKMGYLL